MTPSPKYSIGDLIRCTRRSDGRPVWRSPTGIIIGESQRTSWFGKPYIRWYIILKEDGEIIEEVEEYLEVI
jgi:hypothetical protein